MIDINTELASRWGQGVVIAMIAVALPACGTSGVNASRPAVLSDNEARRPPSGAPAANASKDGQTVYSAEECVGPIVMGKCHGDVIPNRAYHPTCHGEMLNGQCTGPMF